MEPLTRNTLLREFQPPAPMRMSAYFDDVTGGQLPDIGQLHTTSLDKVIEAIEKRPTPGEQAALFAELDRRFVEYGQQHKFLTPLESRSTDQSAEKVADFIIYDVIGYSKGDVQAKSISVFKGKLKEIIADGMNTKGKNALKFVSLMNDLVEAKSIEDVGKILALYGSEGLAQWVKKNWQTVIVRSSKFVGIKGKVRSRLLKWIALRITWLGGWASAISKVVPILVFLDLLLTSESVASDFEEARLSFLSLYGRMSSKRRDVDRRVIDNSSTKEWLTTMPIGDCLKICMRQR